MEISKFTGLSDSDTGAGASSSSLNDLEVAHEQHSQVRHPVMDMRDKKINSLIRSHTISFATGTILSALFFIGFMPNDHASRAEREFNNCLDKSSPADSAAIQACRDAANSIHEIHAKQPSR